MAYALLRKIYTEEPPGVNWNAEPGIGRGPGRARRGGAGTRGKGAVPGPGRPGGSGPMGDGAFKIERGFDGKPE